MTVFKKHLNEEHRRLFTDLYPQDNLIPKHHFMVHYSERICKIGPLLHVWSMRYAAKHKFFTFSIKNVKNIMKSLAKKHQIAVACYCESLSAKALESGPHKMKIQTDVENGDLSSEHFQTDVSSEISVTTWVKHNGPEYHMGLVCLHRFC